MVVMPPLRVLTVSDETPLPHVHERAARRLPLIAGGLRDRGCDVTVALLRGHDVVASALEGHAIPTVRLGFKHYWDAPPALWRLLRVMRAGLFDVVSGREVIPAILTGAATRLARTGGVAEFFRAHTYGGARLNTASRAASLLTDYTHAISGSVAHYAQTLDRTDPARVLVSFVGKEDVRDVPATELRALRASLGIDEAALVVVMVARLRYEKGIDIGIRAMHRLGRLMKNPPEVVVVGSGDEDRSLRAIAAEDRSVRIHFAGHQADVDPWFALADVVVVPSRKEACGLTTIEAMATARPVVATNVGGLPEQVVDGVTGSLVPADAEEAIAKKCAVILAGPAVRERMGAAARQRYEEIFSLDVMLDRWVEMWREQTSARARLPSARERTAWSSRGSS